jgi:CheY-like chemotaxis protein
MATRILVVDDEPDVLESWRKTLELADYSVTAVSRVDEALAACREGPIDLVILDFIMPTMSGLELLNRLREYSPTIRSIVVSGKVDPNHNEDEISTELRVGIEVDAYFHKPLRNEKLLETVAQLLGQEDLRDWKGVADRVLKAKKPGREVKAVEQQLRGRKRKPGAPKSR